MCLWDRGRSGLGARSGGGGVLGRLVGGGYGRCALARQSHVGLTYGEESIAQASLAQRE